MENGKKTRRILIVDDEAGITRIMAAALQPCGYTVLEAASAEAALSLMKTESFDLLVTDLRLGFGMDGLALLQTVRARDPNLPVIVMTAYGTIELAVAAVKLGACDFISKPFKMKEMRSAVERAIAASNGIPASGGPDSFAVTARGGEVHFGLLLGESPQMQRVYERIEKVAKTDATVLITGESGTGKELVAQAIHRCSRRAQAPMVAINCAAMPPNLLESELFGHAAGAFTGAAGRKDGLFAAAHGGTIFLDEIAAMDPAMQAKLLRVLQERVIRRVGETDDMPVDVRVIAATNESLELRKDQGAFREDLFYRISVIPLEILPLRDRTGDLPLLTAHFCRSQGKLLGQKISTSDDVMVAFSAYSWPGNVRELENAIACAAALCHAGNIQLADLPSRIMRGCPNVPLPALAAAGQAVMTAVTDGTPKSLHDFLRDKELEYLEAVICHAGGNRAKAAELLGISRATLYRKLPGEGIVPPPEEARAEASG